MSWTRAGVPDAGMDRARSVYRATLGAAYLAPIPWIAGYLLPPMNGDVAAILYFAVRMVAGGRLYVDLVDVNPPLIFLLTVIPAWIASWSDIEPATMFVGFVLTLIAGSIALSIRLYRTDQPLIRQLGPWLVTFALIVLPWRSFGEREHLMVVLALPWLVLVVARLRRQAIPTWLAITAGVAAATGFLIKPYFGAIPLAAELLLIAQLGPRSWARRPELWVLPTGALLYGAAILSWFPDYLATVAPLAARYYAQTHPLLALAHVFEPDERWVIPIGIVALGLMARRRPEIAVACCLAIGGIASALMQGKGWPYHLVPAWTGLTLGAGLFALDHAPSRKPILAGLVAIALAGLFAIGHPPLEAAEDYAESPEGRLAALVAQHAANKPVLWFTESVWPEYPAVLYAGAKPGMADMELWLLGSLYRAHPGDVMPVGQMGADEHQLYQSVVRSFLASKPALVVVEPKPIDFVAYFSRDPDFARAWADYIQVGQVGNTKLYAPANSVARADQVSD